MPQQSLANTPRAVLPTYTTQNHMALMNPGKSPSIRAPYIKRDGAGYLHDTLNPPGHGDEPALGVSRFEADFCAFVHNRLNGDWYNPISQYKTFQPRSHTLRSLLKLFGAIWEAHRGDHWGMLAQAFLSRYDVHIIGKKGDGSGERTNWTSGVYTQRKLPGDPSVWTESLSRTNPRLLQLHKSLLTMTMTVMMIHCSAKERMTNKFPRTLRPLMTENLQPATMTQAYRERDRKQEKMHQFLMSLTQVTNLSQVPPSCTATTVHLTKHQTQELMTLTGNYYQEQEKLTCP